MCVRELVEKKKKSTQELASKSKVPLTHAQNERDMTRASVASIPCPPKVNKVVN